MKRWNRWLTRFAICAGVGAAFGAAGIAYAWRRMADADKQHAAFCECTTSIKTLMSRFATAVEAAASNRESSPFTSLYADNYQSDRRGRWGLLTERDLGDVTLSSLESNGGDSYDRETVVRELHEYVSGIARVDYVKFKINLIESIEPGVRAVLTVKYVLDGVDTAHQLFQDRFFFRWHIENRKLEPDSDNWQITRDELVEGVRVAGSGRGFERLETNTIGIDYVHRRDPKLDKLDPKVRLKFAVIEHAAGGVSSVDYDDDGRADLFFADGVRSRLYRNVTLPGSTEVAFQDVTSQSGLEGLDQACSAMFGDFDNDGDKDLFVSRYQVPCKIFLANGQGQFVDATATLGMNVTAPCVSSCLLDYDRDGFLDIYIGVNGDAFKEAPDIPFYAVNGRPNHLLRNVAGKKFEDVTQTSRTGSSGWTLAVTSGDYDGDGWPDIAVANDFGRKVLYRNNRDGTFTDRAKDAGVLDFSGGMGIAFADLNGDDAPDLLTSNIESGQRYFGEEITLWQFMRNEIRSGWIWSDLPEYFELYGLLGDNWRDLGKQVGEGNSVFANLGNGKFEEWKECHATRAGWAWSVNPFDFDNDTDMDIYVANGWVSGKKKDDL